MQCLWFRVQSLRPMVVNVIENRFGFMTSSSVLSWKLVRPSGCDIVRAQTAGDLVSTIVSTLRNVDLRFIPITILTRLTSLNL